MTSTAEWIGAGSIGISAWVLLAVVVKLGSDDAHRAADHAWAVYEAGQQSARTLRAAPPRPTYAPDCHLDDATVQLTAVQPASLGRHRKGSHLCI